MSMDDLELALDGSRRRRRAIAVFTFFLVVVFGALFGTLAWSRL
jgi:ABC-type transport system involved in cytochrome c biogenesis permease subunit